MIDQAQNFLEQDFLKHCQELAQQAWESWMSRLQQSGPAAYPFGSFHAAGSGTASSEDMLARGLSDMQHYFDWVRTASGMFGQPNSGQPLDGRQQLQPWLDGFNQFLASMVADFDSRSAHAFALPWQSWMQAMQQGGFNDPRYLQPMAPFGLSREQQLQQQALTAAVLEYLETARRYQTLLQKANAQAVERLQHKLAECDEPARQVESLKALYDVWVDTAEESYAEIALSDEFREVYGAMVNAQMRVRALQQQQVEQWCRELGIPTRSEVASLGQRLQEMRREWRAGATARDDARNDDRAVQITALRAELAVLKKQSATVRKRMQSNATAEPSLKTAAIKKAATSKAPPPTATPLKSAAGKKPDLTKSGPKKSVRAVTRKATPKAASRAIEDKKPVPHSAARKRK